MSGFKMEPSVAIMESGAKRTENIWTGANGAVLKFDRGDYPMRGGGHIGQPCMGYYNLWCKAPCLVHIYSCTKLDLKNWWQVCITKPKL